MDSSYSVLGMLTYIVVYTWGHCVKREILTGRMVLVSADPRKPARLGKLGQKVEHYDCGSLPTSPRYLRQ